MYNKGKEERKWKNWKLAEEKILRDLGVDEKIIEQLYNYDWDTFKSERRYYEKQRECTYLEEIADQNWGEDVYTSGDLLDNIENEKLYELLTSVDKLTLQILVWIIEGYTYSEISRKCHLSVNAVKNRLWYLRKKVKNIL